MESRAHLRKARTWRSKHQTRNISGDALSPLLFVIAIIPLTRVLRKVDDLKVDAKNEKDLESLIQTVRIFSEEIGMEFGLDKCAILIMKRWKTVEAVGVKIT